MSVKKKDTSKRIGGIYNYYGCLLVKEDEGRFFWGIPDCSDSTDWEEIPRYLHDALMKYESERVAGEGAP